MCKPHILFLLECREVFALFDTSGDGKISFDEFLIALRPGMSKGRKDLVRKAFQKCDRTMDGQLTVDDLRGVYKAGRHPKVLTGEMTEDQVFKMFLDTFDTPNNKDGIITLEEFENYYASVSASIEEDPYFDLMMRKAWNL